VGLYWAFPAPYLRGEGQEGEQTEQGLLVKSLEGKGNVEHRKGGEE
jgi:hypothetical protein